MSLDRCDACGRTVDTDYDLGCDIMNRCICETCQERITDNAEEEAL